MSSAQVRPVPNNESANNCTSPKDEEKERQLNQKMEEMRLKNEQLRKRHEEIEADKRNANLNSKIAATKLEDEEDEDSDEEGSDSESESEQFPRGPTTGEVSRHPDSQQPKVGKGRGRLLPNEIVPYQQPGQQGRQSNLPPHNAPPPDPKYKFLDDPIRHGDNGDMGRGGGKGTEFRRGTGRGSVGASRDEVDVPFTYVGKSRGRRLLDPQYHHPPPGMNQSEHERWRQERERVDADRLARQQTSTGQWKREWDVDKQFQRDADQHRGDRHDMRGGHVRAYGDQRKDFRRTQYDNSHSKWQHSREPDQQQYQRRSYEGNEHDRRVHDDGHSMKVTAQFGHERPAARSRPQHDWNRSQDSQQQRRRSDEGSQSHNALQHARPQREHGAKSRPQTLQQEASMDTPSSEYASPEPQLDQPEKAQGDDHEESDQWEDVEENGANEDAYYYDDPQYGGDAAINEHETGQDDGALAAKLEEMESQMRRNQQDDVQGDDQDEPKLVDQITVAAVTEFKEAAPVRRRQTTDGIGEGPELIDEDESQRARHESMDQIEREMIARLNENILAAEAALGCSEEDLDLLLAGTSASVGAPMLEGADEEELFQDDDGGHDNQVDLKQSDETADAAAIGASETNDSNDKNDIHDH